MGRVVLVLLAVLAVLCSALVAAADAGLRPAGADGAPKDVSDEQVRQWALTLAAQGGMDGATGVLAVDKLAAEGLIWVNAGRVAKGLAA